MDVNSPSCAISLFGVVMSDLLLVGQSPSQDVGKEYFLHCMDWWIDIVRAIERCLSASYPFEDQFYSDLWLAPLTPHLSGADAEKLAHELKARRENGDLRQAIVREIETYPEDYFDGFGEEANVAFDETVEERMAQVDEFIAFLGASGGCRAKWYGVDD
jgi:hypothetical protein